VRANHFSVIQKIIESRSWLLAGGLIVLLTILAYLPSVHGDFIWDDHQIFIVNNPLLHDNAGLFDIWFSTKCMDYYPLTYTSFWLDWHLWKLNPTGYHLMNILLHAGSAVLVWRLLKEFRVPGSWLAALLFALHPVNVESVAWISERKNTISMVFYLAATLNYVRFLRRKQEAFYALSLFLFLCALLGKTGVVMLPLVLLGISRWIRGPTEKKDIWRVLPFFALSAVFGLFTVWYHCCRTNPAQARTDGFLSRLAGAGWSIWFYLYKALLPFRLNFVYPRWEIDYTSAWSYLPCALLIVILVVAWRYRRHYGSAVLAAIGYFIVMLLPALGFVGFAYMRFSFVADHLQYYSIVSIIALSVAAGHRLFRHFKAPKQVILGTGAALVAAFFVFSWQRASFFQNETKLYEDSIAKNPQAWLAHVNIGRILVQQGDLVGAFAHYDAAIRSNPELDVAYYNRGLIRFGLGIELDKALSDFNTAIRLNPGFAGAYCYRGQMRMRQDAEAALSDFNITVRLSPNHAGARFFRGCLRAKRGDQAGAVEDFTKALDVAPSNWIFRARAEQIMAGIQGMEADGSPRQPGQITK